MRIYRQEKLDGLEAAIASNNSLAFQSIITESEDVGKAEVLAKASKGLDSTLATNEGQLDLHYVNTILVSTGWNKNDDAFSNEEVWAARNTPEDKPFNFEHDPSDIIGHITGNQAIDHSGSIISNESSIPEKFHILTSGVIYKHIASRDAELSSRVSTIIEEITRGEWFVSMEALFKNFDYAVQTPDGESRVVSRDESSAFLTKHLRSYGGTGFYEGYKVGRLLKDITFSGKGLVRKPANPESVFVFNDFDPFNQNTPVASELQIVSSSLNQDEKENSSMSDTNELQAKVDSLTQRLAEMDEAAVQAKFDEFGAKIEEQEAALTDLAEAKQTLEEQLSESTSAKEAIEAKLAEITEARDTLQGELDIITAEAEKVAKVASLVEAGLSKEVAEEVIAKFEGLSDEQFASIVEVYAAHQTLEQQSQTEEIVAEESAETESEAQAEEVEESVEDDPAEANASEDVLAEAEESEEEALSTAGETPQAEHEDLMTSLANYLDTALHK